MPQSGDANGSKNISEMGKIAAVTPANRVNPNREVVNATLAEQVIELIKSVQFSRPFCFAGDRQFSSGAIKLPRSEQNRTEQPSKRPARSHRLPRLSVPLLK